MHESMKNVRVLFLCLVVLGVSLPAAAQDEARVELSGGYNFIRYFDPEGDDAENFPGGWYGEVAGNLTNMLAVVGQVNGNYKDLEENGGSLDAKVHGFLGGVRVRRRVNERAMPFGHVLVGGTNIKISSDDFDFDESETFFTLQVGGGVNLMATERFSIRVGADYLRVIGKEDSQLELNEDFNVFRFVVGVVLPIGQR